jgi:hypothetical protein
MSERAGETLHPLKRAPVQGSNGYGHKAEDTPEALALRHGASHGDDIAEGSRAMRTQGVSCPERCCASVWAALRAKREDDATRREAGRLRF